jgi:hypothetical protein
MMGPDKWPEIEKRVSKRKLDQCLILRKDQSDDVEGAIFQAP